MVEGWLEGEASVGGFEAVDGAEGSWDADAASAITSQSDGDETCADCVCTAAGGAAGIVLRVIWIWRRSFERVVARSIWTGQLEVKKGCREMYPNRIHAYGVFQRTQLRLLPVSLHTNS